MSRYPEVKLRYLSVIPISNGLGEPAADGDEAWPRYIRTTDIADLDALDASKRVTLPPNVASTAPVLPHDILMTAAGSLGTSYIHSSEEPACYAGYLVRWRVDRTKAFPRFMAYWTRSKHHLDQIAVGAVRSTIDNFSASKFRSMSAPLPPLPEQRAIADFLDRETAQIDATIDAQERLVGLLEERRKAAIHQAVTRGMDPSVEAIDSGIPSAGHRRDRGALCAGESMSRYPEVKLRYLSVIPISNGLGEPAADGDEAWPRYIRTTDIADLDALDASKRVTLPPNVASTAPVLPHDILMTAAGSLGTSYIHSSEEPACYAGYLVRWRVDRTKAFPRFMAYWTRSKHHLDQIAVGAVRSTIDNFSASKFRSMSAPLPPLPEQRAIADFLDRETAQIDAVIAKGNESIGLMKERRAALINAAVTGQIDVRTGVERVGRDAQEVAV